MDKIKTLSAHGMLKILKWAFFILIGLFIVIIIVRVFHFFNLDKTNEQVEKIHNTKLTMDDVTGKYLPPDPGVEGLKTVRGIDINQNGIRDDVEVAIFREYPNSARTRAVLLQYAMILQMETDKLTINKDTATAIAEKESKSYNCIGEIVPISNDDIEKIEAYRNFVENKQLNTKERKNLKTDFDNKAGSFELQSGCDIDLKTLPN